MTKTNELPKELNGFTAPRIVSADGFIFENARGGPYKYGNPLPCTRLNLLAIKHGLL